MTWFARRLRLRLAAHLAEGESIVTHTDCCPLTDDGPDDVARSAVLTERGLYLVAGDQVVALPFTRMHQVRRRGIALLAFRVDPAPPDAEPVVWELRSATFAARAERQFRAHELTGHREWVGGREPGGFLFRAHHDLLSRMSAGTPFHEAVAAQHEYVADAVYGDTGDRAHSRAAARRLRRVHTLLFGELAQLHTAMPTASPAQHAQALAARPAPWPEDGNPPDDGAPVDDVADPDPFRDGADPGTAPVG